MKTITKVLIAGITAALLTACGSSSSSNTTPTAQDQAIDKISNYAQNGGAAPTLQDYLDAGVTGITNVDEINAYVSGLTKEDVDTKEEIQAITSELEVEITANIPPIAKGGSPKTTVEIGETVHFSSTHSTDPDGEIVSYQWFENGRTAARVPYFWKVYNVAGTYNMKLVVTDNDGATSSSEYTVTVTAPVVVAAPPVTVGTPPSNIPIPDPGTIQVKLDVTDAVTDISKVTVSMNIEHVYPWDLKIRLKSPSGTTTLLVDTVATGTSNGGFINTTFDDDAVTPIHSGVNPYTGTFIPQQPLAVFDGENANGEWILIVEDWIGLFAGTFYSWSITVE